MNGARREFGIHQRTPLTVPKHDLQGICSSLIKFAEFLLKEYALRFYATNIFSVFMPRSLRRCKSTAFLRYMQIKTEIFYKKCPNGIRTEQTK